MSVRVPEVEYPVAYVEAWWGDIGASGSGTVIGPDAVLTASHVIYDKYLGEPDYIIISPSFNPDNQDNSIYEVGNWRYYGNFDPDGDGYISPGDRNPSTLGHAETDIALLRTTTPINWFTGSLGKPASHKAKPKSRQAGVLGHPGIYGHYLMGDQGYAVADKTDWIVKYTGLDINSGQSGGPVFNSTGVISPVSTSRFGADVTAHRGWINQELGLSSKSSFPAKQAAGPSGLGKDSAVSAKFPKLLKGKSGGAIPLAELTQINEVHEIVDSLTGLPGEARFTPDHIKNPNRHFMKLPLDAKGLRLVSATAEEVADLLPADIFDSAGTHVFSVQEIESTTNSHTLVVVSDGVPGFTKHADLILYSDKPIQLNGLHEPAFSFLPFG